MRGGTSWLESRGRQWCGCDCGQVGGEGTARGGAEDRCFSCSRAFLEYYQEHLAFACPTEDIYLE